MGISFVGLRDFFDKLLESRRREMSAHAFQPVADLFLVGLGPVWGNHRLPASGLMVQRVARTRRAIVYASEQVISP